MSQPLKTELKKTDATLDTNFIADLVKTLLRLTPVEVQTEKVESDTEQINIRKHDRCKIKYHYVLPLHDDDTPQQGKFLKYYKPLVVRNQLSFTDAQCNEESLAGGKEDNGHDRDADDSEDPDHDGDSELEEEKPISAFNEEILLFPLPIDKKYLQHLVRF
ncbi:unnamed protein product [Didymodactylos carnosus]|uniref:Uncharacterized protein n=1 Tax=Didymodactylos carnosus TaxID=1234261 RepID=A0A815VDC8_9BILA|nr:unnamed protein product [Didymodactylos carnosus]CAF1528662.1 unnamed protein product [Didymodactylos carnosus]CAF4250651.1 unnamed protein product [Didymodactylos carnosus]CAF4387835.1 unnamed protein product [Didymodactylos carnosus]